MQRRTSALTAAALALLPLGQPLLLSTLGIATATTAIVLHATAAVAQDSSDVARIAKAITVRIEGATQGSGVIVKREGNRYTVLTAWHVVSGNRPGEELAISTPDGKKHQLEQGSIQRLGQVDMAVLTINSPGAYEVASVGDVKKVKYDDPIYVTGFPFNNSQNLSFEQGEIVGNAEFGIDQGYQLLYSNKTVPGMSGGALLNADGELIGLHGRGENDEQASTGRVNIIKTGINQGVPITFYNQFLSREPIVATSEVATTSDDYLAMARSSLDKKGREQSVIRAANQSLKIRESAEAFHLIGYSKFYLDDPMGSIINYSKSLKLKSSLAQFTYNNRGHAKTILKDYQGAIADYNRAIAINPKFAVAYTNRGNAKSLSGDYQGAITDFNKTIAIDPRIAAAAYYNRGVTHVKTKNYQGAIVDFSKAIEFIPQSDKLYYNRGYAKYKLKQFQSAISDFTKSLTIYPEAYKPYEMRGRGRADLDDCQGAIVDFTKALEINPRAYKTYEMRGRCKHTLGNYQGAISDYSKAIVINPQFGLAYNNRGYTKANGLGDLKGGCHDFKKAASIGFQLALKWMNSEGSSLCSSIR